MSGDKPLPLITWENGKYTLHQGGLAAVEAIKGPVAVIAVAGLYRTGKSYLLNRLLDRQAGFDVGPTINACTKALSSLTRKVGDLHRGMLMRIGLGSFDATATHDVKIFSLAILLSSYFIYNSMGTIDENALDKLSLVTHLTEHIQLRTKAKEQDSAQLAKYFPRFLWVVRDFSLQLKDESGSSISEAEYLERALSEKHGGRSEEKNAIRKAIKRFFPQRDCVTLVRPVENEAKLQSIDKTPYKDLRDEFRKKMESVRGKILNEAEAKRDGSSGALISGAAWGALVRKYVEALNKGAVPNISDSWASVVAKEGQRAVDEAIAALTAALPKEVAREEEWDQAKLSAREAALKAFAAIAIGGEEDLAPHRHSLERKIERELKDADAKIRDSARTAAQKALEVAFSAFMQRVQAGSIKDPTSVFADWDIVARKALSTVKGLASEHRAVLADFTANKLPLAQTAVYNQVQAAERKRLEDLQVSLRQKEESLLSETKKAAAAEASLDREKSKSERALDDVNRLKAEVAEGKEAKKRVDTELASRQVKIDQLTKEIEHLKAELVAARSKQAESESAQSTSMRALREEVTELKRQLSDRSDELKAKATQVKDLEKQVKKLEGMQGETLQNATQMQGKAELVQRQLEEYMRKVADAESAKRKHDEYRREMEAELETTKRRVKELTAELQEAQVAARSAASAVAPAAATLPVTVVDEKSTQNGDEEDESDAQKTPGKGKRSRDGASTGAKRAKNLKGEKAVATGDAKSAYEALTAMQLKRVLLDANVKTPIGKPSKGDLVALCVANDAKCREHIDN